MYDLFLLWLHESCASTGCMVHDWQTDRYSPPHKLQPERKRRIKGFMKQSYFSASCAEVLKQGVMHRVTKFKHVFFGKSS